jgi:hypothetical protein
MGNLGKFMGSNWLQGPYYPQTGFGKIFTPVSKLPKMGTMGAAITAFRTGYWAGSKLDKWTGASTRISNNLANRTPSSMKWWIHKHL